MNKSTKFPIAAFIWIYFLLGMLALITILYIRTFVANLNLQVSLGAWVQIAAFTSASDDYEKNEKGFYQVNTTVKHRTIIGLREGYPVRAWALSVDNEGSSQEYVDAYNKRMERLIHSNK
ncbi:MAG TPA: hypothetical protein VL981_06510 [Candidatus Methylacidiphilales bacterium]|nr:hypothetical protein [Candidatus Methylacidiphilales bacterium]